MDLANTYFNNFNASKAMSNWQITVPLNYNLISPLVDTRGNTQYFVS